MTGRFALLSTPFLKTRKPAFQNTHAHGGGGAPSRSSWRFNRKFRLRGFFYMRSRPECLHKAPEQEVLPSSSAFPSCPAGGVAMAEESGAALVSQLPPGEGHEGREAPPNPRFVSRFNVSSCVPVSPRRMSRHRQRPGGQSGRLPGMPQPGLVRLGEGR